MPTSYHLSNNWNKLIKSEIEVLLAPLSDRLGFKYLVREVLNKSGSCFVTGDVHEWSLLPIMVCESVGGHYHRALPVSAAIQLLIAAGEIFDDIEDADSSESLSSKYGSPVATNLATTLIILAERAITLLKRKDVSDDIIVRIMDALNFLYAEACAGQHSDLTSLQDTVLTEEMYLNVAGMKSASTPACACHIGALLATEDQELIDTFTIFGYNLGMASQIANDIRGITHGRDIIEKKITLPIIYSLSHTGSEIRDRLESTYLHQYETGADHIQTRNLLFSSGAIHYAIIKIEIYKERALANLFEAESKGARVEQLGQVMGLV